MSQFSSIKTRVVNKLRRCSKATENVICLARQEICTCKKAHIQFTTVFIMLCESLRDPETDR